MVSLIRKYVKTRKLRISETMLKFYLCLLRLSSLSVVKPSPTCGFADSWFWHNRTNADQRNHQKSVVSLIRKFADSWFWHNLTNADQRNHKKCGFADSQIRWFATLPKNSTLGIFCDKLMGCGCSTVIEHTPHDRKLEGLNPAGRWVFFLLLFFPTLHHYLLVFFKS